MVVQQLILYKKTLQIISNNLIYVNINKTAEYNLMHDIIIYLTKGELMQK